MSLIKTLLVCWDVGNWCKFVTRSWGCELVGNWCKFVVRSWGRNVVGNWCKFVVRSWGGEFMGKGNPQNPKTADEQ